MKYKTTQHKRGWARAASAWGPVAVCMAVIFVASGLPKVTLPGITLFTDKASHAIGYSGLALLAYRAVVLAPLSARRGPYIQAFTVSALYGASDEYHQSFVPGRSSDIVDWVVDVLGAVIALALIAFIHRLTANGGEGN